jgi:hypothetical protein
VPGASLWTQSLCLHGKDHIERYPDALQLIVGLFACVVLMFVVKIQFNRFLIGNKQPA